MGDKKNIPPCPKIYSPSKHTVCDFFEVDDNDDEEDDDEEVEDDDNDNVNNDNDDDEDGNDDDDGDDGDDNDNDKADCQAMSMLLLHAVDKEQMRLHLPTAVVEEILETKPVFVDWTTLVAEDDNGWMYKTLQADQKSILDAVTKHLIWPADSF